MSHNRDVYPTSQNFLDGVNYSLSKLGMSHIKLKDQQKQAILVAYDGKDVFVILPTGFGKSVCFQVLPFLFDHKLGLTDGTKKCVIVVSPLVSLMVDATPMRWSQQRWPVTLNDHKR